MNDNTYCRALGIDPPALDEIARQRDATPAVLLVIALLEAGEAMTLDELADRYERAAIASEEQARPLIIDGLTAPVYRTDERFALDVLSDELERVLLHFDLRDSPAPPRLPDAQRPLSIGELRLAWVDLHLGSWSARRLALAVLDAHRPEPMAPTEVVDFIASCRPRQPGPLTAETRWPPSPHAAITTDPDGRWRIADPRHRSLGSARLAVGQAIETGHHQRNVPRADTEARRSNAAIYARRRGAEAQRWASLRRLIIHAFPRERPSAIALHDLTARRTESFGPDEFDEVRDLLIDFDLIAGLDVQTVLATLGIDPGPRPLHDLAATQKKRRLGDGTTLAIDTAQLIEWSCRLIRPLGRPRMMQRHLEAGRIERVRQQLEDDLFALHALYRFGAMHGTLRIRANGLDERIPAPWSHPTEAKIWDLMAHAESEALWLGVVPHRPPPFERPTEGELRVRVIRGSATQRGQTWLATEGGEIIATETVQAARLLDD